MAKYAFFGLTSMLLVGFQLQQLELQRFEWCRDPDGYWIEHRHVYLSPEHFERGYLIEALRELAAGIEAPEAYLTVSPDLSFLQTIYSLPPSVAENPRLAYPLEIPIKTEQPLAYLYKVRDNVFASFRDGSGAVDSVVLQGEDLFERRIGRAQSYFAGQYFSGRWKDETCSNRHRMLTLVVEGLEDLERSEIVEWLKFYDSTIDYPEQFLLRLVSSFESAGQMLRFTRPSLRGDLTPRDSAELKRSVSFLRHKAGDRIDRTMSISEGWNQPPVFFGAFPPDDEK